MPNVCTQEEAVANEQHVADNRTPPAANLCVSALVQLCSSCLYTQD